MKIEELMNRYYDLFTTNDQYICQCILNHKEDCINLSIDEFATKYHVSTSTLSRFAQKLKLPGYSELRVILRLNQTEIVNESINIDSMMDCYQKVITDLETKDCSIMFERMHQAKRIIIFGEGYSQGRVAKEMKRIFLPTGKKIYDIYGFDMIDSLRTFIDNEDVVIFISVHGKSLELIQLAKELQMKGIYMISITKMISNTLSRLCNDNLYIQAIDFPISKDSSYEITTPFFILIELLYVKYKMYWVDVHSCTE